MSRLTQALLLLAAASAFPANASAALPICVEFASPRNSQLTDAQAFGSDGRSRMEPLEALDAPAAGAASSRSRAASDPASMNLMDTEVPFRDDRVKSVAQHRTSAADELPLPFEDLPWCSSADDPRCSPRDAGHSDATTDGRALSIVCPSMLPAPPWPTGSQTQSACLGISPRASTAGRLERPPRRIPRAH